MNLRRPPRPKILAYQDPKIAAGGRGGGRGTRGGGGDNGGFRAGQNLIVRVMNTEPGGYSVLILGHNIRGFLMTQALLRAGEKILAQFVCVHNHRTFLSSILE